MFREAFDGIAEQIDLMSGGERIPLSLPDVDVPEIGDTALPRLSGAMVAGPLPAGQAPLVVAWHARLGALVVRRIAAGSGAHTGYLTNGVASEEITRAGAASQTGFRAFLSFIPVGFQQIVPLRPDHILVVPGRFGLPTLHGWTLGSGLLPLAALIMVLPSLPGAALALDRDGTCHRDVANPASVLIALVGSHWVVGWVFL